MFRAVTRAGPVAAAAATPLARATTTFHTSWANPAARSCDLEGKRVAALVLCEEDPLRYAAEDALARRITERGHGWGGADDGYLHVDAILAVETLVYGLPRNELVWASQSGPINPTEVGPFIRKLSGKVGAEMARQDLLGDRVRVSAVGF